MIPIKKLERKNYHEVEEREKKAGCDVIVISGNTKPLCGDIE
jgi:hypothetical protein